MSLLPLLLLAGAGVAAGCRGVSEPISAEIAIEIASVSPRAAVRGTGCFTVAGVALEQVSRARIGGVEVGVEAVPEPGGGVRVCAPSSLFPGAATLELGTAGGFVSAPTPVSILESSLSLAPADARVAPGDSVTLQGSGFDILNTDNNRVDFGGVAGTVTAAFANRLLVDVPAGAMTSEVQVSIADSDPPAPPASGGRITVVQPFAITGIDTRTPEGAFWSEQIVVRLDRLVEETSRTTPSVSVDGEAAEVVAAVDDRLSVQLPSLLPVGDAAVEVRGDLATASSTVRILGPGHTDLQRTPTCRTLELPVGMLPLSNLPVTLFTERHLQEAIAPLRGVAFVDNALKGSYAMGIGAPSALVIPFPSDAVVTSAAVHFGTPPQPDSGFIAVYDLVRNAVFATFNWSGVESTVVLPEELVPIDVVAIDDHRLFMLGGDVGSTQLAVVDLRAEPPEQVTYVEETRIPRGFRPVDPASPTQWLMPTQSPTDRDVIEWSAIDLGADGAAPTHVPEPSVTPLATDFGREDVRLVDWIPDAGVALLTNGDTRYQVESPGTFAYLALFDRPLDPTSVQIVELHVQGGNGTLPPFMAMSAETTFNGRPGHWLVHERVAFGGPFAIYVAFLPPPSDPFWSGLTTLVLPADDWDGAGVDGGVIPDSLGGIPWIAADTGGPRRAVLYNGFRRQAATIIELSDDPREVAVIEDLGRAEATAAGSFGGVASGLLLRDGEGNLTLIDAARGSAIQIDAQVGAPSSLVRYPGTGLMGLRMPERSEIFVDATGVIAGTYGKVAGGPPVYDPTTGSLATVAVDPAGPELVGTPFIPDPLALWHSDVGAEWRVPLGEIAGPCSTPLNSDLVSVTNAPVLSAGLLQGVCFASPGSGCAPDPSAPAFALPARCELGGPLYQSGELYVWSTEGATQTGVDPSPTGLCGNELQVERVANGFGTGELLVVMRVGYWESFGNICIGFPRNLASLLHLAPGSVQNLTPGIAGTAAVALTGADVLAATTINGLVTDPLNQRWLATRQPAEPVTELVAIDGLTLEQTLLTSIPVRTSAALMAPDGQRIYLVSLDAQEIWVLANAEVPFVIGVTVLADRAYELDLTDNGAAIIATVDDGYCVLSD